MLTIVKYVIELLTSIQRVGLVIIKYDKDFKVKMILPAIRYPILLFFIKKISRVLD